MNVLTRAKKRKAKKAEARCGVHATLRVKRRFVALVGELVDFPEWVRCVLNEGHDGEHEYD